MTPTSADDGASAPARTTRAVAHLNAGPLDGPGALLDVDLEVAAPGPRDLLVEVRAVSVNPVDVKVRATRDPGGRPGVLGFDAAGVVVAVGADVTSFAVGEEVYYAGSLERAGSDAGLQLVDERLVGHKPRTLSFAEAAALPLTALTAWEALFGALALEEGAEARCSSWGPRAASGRCCCSSRAPGPGCACWPPRAVPSPRSGCGSWAPTTSWTTATCATPSWPSCPRAWTTW